MESKTRMFLILFAAILAIGIVGQAYFFWHGMEELQWLTIRVLAILMILPPLFLFLKSRFKDLRYVAFVILSSALILSPDVFAPASMIWMYYGVGLGVYILSFIKRDSKQLEIPLAKRYPLMVILPLAGILLFFIKVREYLGNEELPLLLFCLISAGLIYLSINRWNRTSNHEFGWAMTGVIFTIGAIMISVWTAFLRDFSWQYWLFIPFYVMGNFVFFISTFNQPKVN